MGFFDSPVIRGRLITLEPLAPEMAPELAEAIAEGGTVHASLREAARSG